MTAASGRHIAKVLSSSNSGLHQLYLAENDLKDALPPVTAALRCVQLTPHTSSLLTPYSSLFFPQLCPSLLFVFLVNASVSVCVSLSFCLCVTLMYVCVCFFLCLCTHRRSSATGNPMSCLRVLDVSHCGLDAAAAKSFSELLSDNRTLEMLHIAANPVSAVLCPSLFSVV